MCDDDKRYQVKVTLLGDSGTGKTAIALRFTAASFNNDVRSTIGASQLTKNVVVDDYVIRYHIWDTAGQERFHFLADGYLRGTHIALIVYSVDDKLSFQHLSTWLERLEPHKDIMHTVIVGNKVDLDKQVDDDTALALAQQHGKQLVYVSVKTGYNINELFHRTGVRVVQDMISRRQSKPPHNPLTPLRKTPPDTEQEPPQPKEDDGNAGETVDKENHCCSIL